MTGFVSPISPGYIVRATERGDKEEWQHRLFGSHSIAGAASPNSRRPLLRLLRLDTADPRLGLNGGPGEALPLMFSWSCEMSQAPVIYRLKSSAAIELMVYRRGKVYGDFPYAEYPSHFPERIAALVPIPAKEQDAIRDLNSGRLAPTDLPAHQRDLRAPRHQVGGEPFPVQPWESLDCPSCSRPMPFVASIGDDTGTPEGLTGNPFVQTCFSYCRPCRVVAARQ